MARKRILVVDDERDIRELISYNLSRSGYEVLTVATGEDAIAKAQAELPELILLDLMLPGVDGMDVCRALKGDPRTGSIPVIMVTAKGEEIDVVTGLEIGADDYITKPFSPRILTARVRAMLRKFDSRTSGDSAEVIKRGILVIDPNRHEVTANGEAIDVTLTEFRILQTLAKRPGRVFSRNQIIREVHGDGYPVTERSVDVQVVGLRKTLGPLGEHIETVRGVGYRWRD